VYDNVTYLASLGKAQTAAVKRDAEIGVAQVSGIKHGVTEPHHLYDASNNFDVIPVLSDPSLTLQQAKSKPKY
jgi:hypothetical protein